LHVPSADLEHVCVLFHQIHVRLIQRFGDDLESKAFADFS
jgi:hypothetical protein